MRFWMLLVAMATACAGTDAPAPELTEVAPVCDTACACDLIEQAPVMTGTLFRQWADLGCGHLDVDGAR